MRATAIAASLTAVLALFGGVAVAEEQRNDLQASYLLWGMMEGSGNTCWEIASWDVQYMQELEGWKQRNLPVRDELETVRVAAGIPESFASRSEAEGNSGMTDVFRRATNGPEACAKWLNDTRSGVLDAEVYLAEPLGRLRERDGL